MKLPVYLYGHPVLRAENEALEKDTEGLKDLVAKMFDAMYESEGVGLAAPRSAAISAWLLSMPTLLAIASPNAQAAN